MHYGELTLFVGPMFAEKTNSLIKEILYRTYFSEEEPAAVYAPSFDQRYGGCDITSHTGLRVQATRVSSVRDVHSTGFRWIFFDEVQFFTPPHFEGNLIDRIRQIRAEGCDVFCAGLDMDYLGRGFEVTGQLMAEASSLHRLTARCQCCGAPATHTARLAPGRRRFEIGAAESYAPMCAFHWFRDREARVDRGSEEDVT